VTTFYKEVKAVAVRSQDARPFILGRGAMSFTLLTPSGYTAPEGDFLLESEGSQSNVTQLPGAHDTRLPVDLVLRGDTPCYALALSAGDGAENHAATSVDGTVHCDGDPSRVAWTRIIHGAGAQHLHDLSYEIGPNTLMSCGVADEALTIGATVVPNTGPRVWVAAFDANDGTLRWVDNATVADGVIQTTRVGGHGDPSGMVLAVDHDGQLDTPAGIVGSPNAPRQVTVAHWHLSP
jgi:hypothetical protein